MNIDPLTLSLVWVVCIAGALGVSGIFDRMPRTKAKTHRESVGSIPVPPVTTSHKVEVRHIEMRGFRLYTTTVQDSGEMVSAMVVHS